MPIAFLTIDVGGKPVQITSIEAWALMGLAVCLIAVLWHGLRGMVDELRDLRKDFNGFQLKVIENFATKLDLQKEISSHTQAYHED